MGTEHFAATKVVQAGYSPPPGFAQRNGEGTQKAQFRAQDAQKRRAKDVFLCFLWLLCASCVPFPSRCAKPGRRGGSRPNIQQDRGSAAALSPDGEGSIAYLLSGWNVTVYAGPPISLIVVPSAVYSAITP